MRIYLDHNATTPVDRAAVEAMMRVLEHLFGNASSVHYYGQQAKAAIDDARSAVAALVGAEPAEVIFTSGGTEADNFAIRGAAEALEVTGRRHLITSGSSTRRSSIPSKRWRSAAGGRQSCRSMQAALSIPIGCATP